MKQDRTFIFYLLLVLFSSIAIQIPPHNRGLLFFDEGVIYQYAENILKGQVFFRDIFSYMSPGMFYTLALLYKIFGVSVLVSRYAITVVFSATAILVFLICRHLMAQWLAFLTAIVFAAYRVWAFPIWNYAGYATFSIFFLSVALLLLMKFIESPGARPAFLTGFFAAVAAMFKQDYGVFAGLGMFLIILLRPYLQPRSVAESAPASSRLRTTLAFVAGGITVCVPIFIYFILQGALDDMVRQTLVIPLTLEVKRQAAPRMPILPLFRQDSGIRGSWNEYAPSVSFMWLLMNFQSGTPAGFLYARTTVWEMLLKLIHYMPYLASLLAAAIVAKRLIKRTMSLKHQKAAAVALICILLFMTQHRPFDFAHLMQMYLPVFLLAGFIVDALYEEIHSNKKLSYPVFGALAALFGIYLVYTVWAASFIVKCYPAKLEGPRANIYLSKHDHDVCAQAISFIRERTSPDEPIYVLPKHALFYFLADRRNPTRFQNLWPVKVEEDMDRGIINALERERVEYIMEIPQTFKGFGSYQDYAPEVAYYVKMNFSPETRFGDPLRGLQVIILRRKHETT